MTLSLPPQSTLSTLAVARLRCFQLRRSNSYSRQYTLVSKSRLRQSGSHHGDESRDCDARSCSMSFTGSESIARVLARKPLMIANSHAWAALILPRRHDKPFKYLRDAGFDNVSFDLIAGLAGPDSRGVGTKSR